MIKKLTLPILVLIFSAKCFSQNFVETRELYSAPQCCGAVMAGTADYFSFDKYGRAYYHIYEHICTFCTNDDYFNRYKFSNGTASYHMFDVGGAEFSGNYNSFYAIYNSSLKKITNSSSVWSVPLASWYNFVSDDYFGNVYLLKTDSLSKYDSTGTLLWVKSGGGNIIKADASGNYYIANTNFTKYDSSGNVIRVLPYSTSNFVIDDSCNVYMAYGGITKLDSAGNVIFQFPQGASKLAVDIYHNIYFLSGSTVGKLDSVGTAVKWTKSFPSSTPRDLGVDSLFNCYVLSDLASGFIPPSAYFTYNTASSNSYYLAITKLSSQIYSDTVVTYNVSPYYHRLCAGDSINISFRFYLPTLSPPFKAELSDSTGSFANPLLLGTGTGNHFKVLIPSSVPSANGYRIRVTTTSGSPILFPNSDGPFRINSKPPVPNVTAINFSTFQNGIFYGCTGNPIQLFVDSSSQYNFNWYNYTNLIYGATDSIYTITNYSFQNYSVKITDTATGCWQYSNPVLVSFSSAIALSISGLPDSICISSDSITLTGLPFNNGIFTGDGVYNHTFYPDSAGPGLHQIIYSYNYAGCVSYDTAFVLVEQPLQIYFSGFPDSVCLNTNPLTLIPSINGGIFTGDGVSGNIFYPDSAGSGSHPITYNLTNQCGTYNTTENIYVNPLPIVYFNGLPDTMCLNSPIISLNPFPAGGTFSGNGISSNIFFAYAAGSGNDTITYQYTDSNGCSNSYSQNVFIDVCSGLIDLENHNFHLQILPNPTSGKFTIQASSEIISQIIITNPSGQTIYKKEFNDFPSGNSGDGFEINLSKLPKGIYLIQAITNNKVYNLKIILD